MNLDDMNDIISLCVKNLGDVLVFIKNHKFERDVYRGV